MLNKFKYFFLFFCSAGLSIAWMGISHYPTLDVVHKITIHHPGMSEDKSCLLIEQKDKENNTLAFFMDVKSVICLDGKCKIVDVRLFWNRLGEYLKYTLDKGVELEKKDGAPFTDTDYIKLQLILKDKESPFSQFALGEVVDLKKNDAGIDGISGATVLTEEYATVKGATWTCYTLWHWANSDIQNIIKDITEKSASKEELFLFLKKENDVFKGFALDQFKDRKMYDQNTLDSVKNTLLTLNITPIKAAVDYFKAAPDDLFFTTLKEVFPIENNQKRLVYLKALFDEKQETTPDLVLSILQFIPRLKTYQEINLMIDFLEKTQLDDLKLNEKLISFLEHKDFIIARRIYWYLSEQNLKPLDQNKVKVFGKLHEDNL